jgi:hypothetical protein
LVLDPGNLWCIREYKCFVPSLGLNSVALVEYRGGSDPKLPMVQKTTNHMQGRDGGGTKVVCIFESVQFRTIPEQGFTLSAFGFLEPKGMEIAQTGSRWYFWFIGAGVAALIVAACLRAVLKRRRYEDAR